MSNIVKPIDNIKNFLESVDVKSRFERVMQENAGAFLSSVLQAVSSNEYLVKADPITVFNSAMVAATLNLPVIPQLGFAFLIPYKEGNKQVCQFQLGAKGFKQLALRSSMYEKISYTDVRQGELKMVNYLTNDYHFEWEQDFEKRQQLPVIGYASYLGLQNGYNHVYMMHNSELQAHAQKFSKTWNHANGQWKNNFPAMALKTVTKLNLSKNGPLSTDLITGIKFDQAVIRDLDGNKFDYPDNGEGGETIPQEPKISAEDKRILTMLNDCVSIDDLMNIKEHVPAHLQEQYETKFSQLMGVD